MLQEVRETTTSGQRVLGFLVSNGTARRHKYNYRDKHTCKHDVAVALAQPRISVISHSPVVSPRPGLLGATLTGVFLASAGDFPRAGDFLRAGDFPRAGDLPRAGDCASDLPRAAGALDKPSTCGRERT